MSKRVSVAMATYNGEKYIKEQIDSILINLKEDDELVISDDGSTDKTIEIINSYRDDRIKVLEGPKKGIKQNFENAIKNTNGEIIFISDQDDVWMPNKVEKTLSIYEKEEVTLVIHDCEIVDKDLNCIDKSFFEFRKSGKGKIKNIWKNTYIGCCMSFKKEIKEKILPIPNDIYMHDQWIGLTNEKYGKSYFLNEKLIKYRRHGENNDELKRKSLGEMIKNRTNLMKNLMTKENKISLIIGIILIVLTLALNMIKVSLEILIATFIGMYLLFFIHNIIKFKSLKQLILSAEFIYMSIFFIYAIPASIMFVIDGYEPRVNFFTIDYVTMLRTLQLYFNIFMILLIYIVLTNGPKTFKEETKTETGKINKISAIIVNILAIILVFYFCYLHFRNGINIFTEYFHNIRAAIESSIHNFNSYIYLFMIPYSYIHLSPIIDAVLNKKEKKNKIKENLLQIVIITVFWILSIFTDRRNLVTLLFMLFIHYIIKIDKIKLKMVISVFLVVCILLGMSFTRSRDKFTLDNVFFYANGEFILTNYVSQYYINNVEQENLLLGRTYFVDTFTTLIPQKIYKNKPQLLSEIFKEEANTNVAYAYNPVAEGIVNYGPIGATFFVPIVILFFINMCYYLGRKNKIYYILILSSSINFFRGIFANTIFTIIVMGVFMYIINGKYNLLSKWRKKWKKSL